LETSLLRSEAKLAEVDPTNPKYQDRSSIVDNRSSTITDSQNGTKVVHVDWSIEDFDSEEDLTARTYTQFDTGSDHPNSGTEGAQTASEAAKSRARKMGQSRWRALLTERFIEGRDDSFDYTVVDSNESLDEDWVGQKAQEDWFDEEEEVLEGTEGETGVQDF
jgi:hypothetical protein